jgi:hypothetical protein
MQAQQLTSCGTSITASSPVSISPQTGRWLMMMPMTLKKWIKRA